MSPLRALARPLLASVFVVEGIDAVRHADRHAAAAEPIRPALARLAERVPGLPADPKSLTRLLGAVQIGAGVLLATGKAPRVAAGVLAVITVPTTLARHPAWAASGEERRDHAGGLLRGAALLGGLIFAAEDRQGRPSLGWRVENWREHRTQLDDLRDELRIKAKEAKVAVKEAAVDARSAI